MSQNRPRTPYPSDSYKGRVRTRPLERPGEYDPGTPERDPDLAGGTRGSHRASRGVRRRLSLRQRVLKGTFFGLILTLLLGLLGYLLIPVPDPKTAAISQANVYLYDDGTELARGGANGQQTRQLVKLDQVPQNVRDAVLAAENRTFYKDSGVSPKAILRAFLNNVSGGEQQGGSTITQQYVKQALLSEERSLKRKLMEFFIALKLDKQKSKDEILTDYLNTIYFGRGAHGIQAASRAYFDVDVEKITLAEGAYLASLIRAPGAYENAPTNPEIQQKLHDRWDYVLDGMVKSGWLDQGQRETIAFPTPIPKKQSLTMAGQTGYLITAVNDYLVKNSILSATELARGGYVIKTTISKEAQAAAVRSVEEFRTQLKPNRREADKYARVALASVVPGDGAVKALYGGPDYLKRQFNDATRATVQAGSTFKIFTLAAAFRDGINGQPVSPESYFNGNSDQTFVYQGRPYTISNEDNLNYGSISLRRAAQVSSNTVFVKLGIDVGPDKVRQAAIDAGIPEKTGGFEPTPSLTLGVASPTTLDMANAFATFAARGERAKPYLVSTSQAQDPAGFRRESRR
jgi:membrane peptidoglycan carboxypeptidase